SNGGLGGAGRASGENVFGPEATRLPADPAITHAHESAQPLARVVQAHPASPVAWALLADEAHANERIIESYAFARVGYHRGLDALRRAGWKGHGPVPWAHGPNRGAVRARDALRRAPCRRGETHEE